MYSLIIPVYNNEQFLPELLTIVANLNKQLNKQLEVVFVVDGSPDNSYTLLEKSLPTQAFTSQLILLSRNFGSLTAIRIGLERANGQLFAIMAADLQEPPQLVVDFFKALEFVARNAFAFVISAICLSVFISMLPPGMF